MFLYTYNIDMKYLIEIWYMSIILYDLIWAQFVAVTKQYNWNCINEPLDSYINVERWSKICKVNPANCNEICNKYKWEKSTVFKVLQETCFCIPLVIQITFICY